MQALAGQPVEALGTDDSATATTAGQQLQTPNYKANSLHDTETLILETELLNVAEPQTKREVTMLLDLPTEILEMILLVLPPDSFSCMLMVSKSIRATILSTQKVLRTQLRNIPGLRLPDQATTKQLLAAFNGRAAKTAWNGLETFADVVVHQPQLPGSLNDLWTRTRVNGLQVCCAGSKGCEHGLLATAADYRGIIHVYRVRKGRISPLCQLDPRTINQEDDGSRKMRYRCEAIRWQRCNTTDHNNHLIALFSYSIDGASRTEKGKFAQEFIQDATRKSQITYFLVCWNLCKTIVTPWAWHEFTLPPAFYPQIMTNKEDSSKEQACQPVALISYCAQLNSYLITIFQITPSRITAVPVKSSEVGAEDSLGIKISQPILRASFTKGSHPELWLYGTDTAPIENIPGCGTPGVSQLRLASSVSTGRWVPYLFSSTATPRSFKGIPIKSNHDHECGTYENGSKYCVQTVSDLLPESALRHQRWLTGVQVLELVVPRQNVDKVPGAYLVKYAEEQDTCSPFDLSIELPALEYTVVAKLLGSDYKVQSPMGRIIALSSNKEWIAIAHWDRVLLWGIHTKAFFFPSKGSLPEGGHFTLQDGWIVTDKWTDKQNKARRQEWAASDDKAYSTNCAQGYFHDHIRIKGDENERQRIVGIRPIELPSRGVVFSMAFAKHNCLWAWTDRGLVKWAWNRKRKGVREDVPLNMVADNMWAYV